MPSLSQWLSEKWERSHKQLVDKWQHSGPIKLLFMRERRAGYGLRTVVSQACYRRNKGLIDVWFIEDTVYVHQPGQ